MEMEFCIVHSDNIITNILVFDDAATAAEFGAVPSYDGASIGTAYEPPADPVPTPAQLREEAYNTQTIIPWGGEMLTVTDAAQLWQYYAAEGNTAKTDELTALIAAAKASIREQYPD